MTRLEGRYHDGRTSRSQPVAVVFHAEGTVTIEGGPVRLHLRREQVALSPRLGRTPRTLSLPGGATCEIPDHPELDAAAGRAGGAAPRLLASLEQRWPAALLAAALGGALLAALVSFGIPALARHVARALPVEVDAKLGEGGLEALDRSVFAESALGETDRERIRSRFGRLAALAETPTHPRLAFRAGGRAGANAFALPSGVVVVTDELVGLAGDDTHLSAVLAHELGHVAHRHALRSVLQNAGVGVLVAAAVGDLGSVASLAGALPALLVELRYSRRFESEADAYAVALLARAGLAPGALAEVLERLERQRGAAAPAYLSSHPPTRERIRAIRAATP